MGFDGSDSELAAFAAIAQLIRGSIDAAIAGTERAIFEIQECGASMRRRLAMHQGIALLSRVVSIFISHRNLIHYSNADNFMKLLNLLNVEKFFQIQIALQMVMVVQKK